MALSGTTTTSARLLPLSPPTTTNSSTAKPSSLSFHSLSSSTSLSLRLSSHKRGLKTVNVSGGKLGTVVTTKCFASDPAQLKTAREDIKELLKTTFCHPILQLTPSAVELEERFQKYRQIKLIYDAIVRLGWHDAGTYNKNIEEWPQRGLVNALKLLQPIKDKYTGVTYADLFQLASATAVEEAGGPKIPMKYGRVDVSGPEQCPEEGRLPDAGPPSPADHLRAVFYRMGLSDKDIVALSGAHTLGRSRPERSGWGKPETKYTKEGPGAPGGQSWTVKWLRFDNSYFKDIKEKRDEDLLVLPTDAALFDDPSFKVFAEKYAEDEKAFFTDYAEAHAKLSNLGAKFDPAEGFSIDDEPAAPVGEKFVAAKYSSGKRELSDAMKQKIRSEYVGFGGSPDKPLQSNYFLNIIIVIAVLAILTSLVGN
ncbi:probable L-ascorbate peroxidase 6, chloroplastic/mitochondrial isoform X1 [Tanacetum coccineum]